MKTEKVTMNKKLSLRCYCLLIQASASLERSKLGWDAQDGLDTLHAFYKGNRSNQLRAIISELTVLIGTHVSLDHIRLRNLLNVRFHEAPIFCQDILGFLSRVKFTYSFLPDEITFLVSCFTTFLSILEDTDIPNLETARNFKGDIGIALQILAVRCWYMPQFELAKWVEIVSPPAEGQRFSIDEIVSRL